MVLHLSQTAHGIRHMACPLSALNTRHCSQKSVFYNPSLAPTDKNLTRNSFLCSAFFVSFRTSAGSTSLTCASCRQGIRDEDMVHQVLDQVFHQRCFNCSLCARPLQTGEKFYGGLDGKVVCGRHDQLLDRANFRKDVSSVAATSSSGSRSTSDQVSPMSATTTASSASASSTNTSTGKSRDIVIVIRV